ncbi:hypothetical protein BDF20DRAFT_858968 [Mycotypha africana]|uniref:uncharacterized protein n=1 Tax=Mycotypha africana TaxID=64632 RepID=UPI002301EE24|nr:uncharacterized protein BDF20DRAFT_858968 [Mycotypha africana]KAI8984271.1 hypothetical protein BDF20DRAFT_858968 [Mycotypha africana]
MENINVSHSLAPSLHDRQSHNHHVATVLPATTITSSDENQDVAHLTAVKDEQELVTTQPSNDNITGSVVNRSALPNPMQESTNDNDTNQRLAVPQIQEPSPRGTTANSSTTALFNSQMVHIVPTNLSMPPEYSRVDQLEKYQQQAQYDALQLARLEAFHRTNPGIVIYKYFNRHSSSHHENAMLSSTLREDESGHTISLNNALYACVVFQFWGFPVTFWLLLFGFIGCLSFIVHEMPNLYLLLWIPLGLYLIGVKVVHSRQRRWLARLEDLESQVQQERSRRLITGRTSHDNSSRTTEEEVIKDKYKDHFFIIMEDENHSHSVVTLLPPPPAYLKANDQ